MEPYSPISEVTKQPPFEMPKDRTRVFLIRHAHAYDGQGLQMQDSELSKEGLWQAKQLSKRLKAVPVDKIYSSPTKRALQTARIVAKAHPHAKIKVEDYLQELFWEFWPELGHFHYDHAQELETKLGVDDQLKMLGAVQKKGLDILGRLYNENKGKAIFVFTHGNLIRSVVSAVMESGIKGFLSLEVNLASITILDLSEDTYRIVTVSDGCHTLHPKK